MGREIRIAAGIAAVAVLTTLGAVAVIARIVRSNAAPTPIMTATSRDDAERGWTPPPGSWEAARDKTKRTWKLPPGTRVIVAPVDGKSTLMVNPETGGSTHVNTGTEAIVGRE
jgi:hypothetical protein